MVELDIGRTVLRNKISRRIPITILLVLMGIGVIQSSRAQPQDLEKPTALTSIKIGKLWGRNNVSNFGYIGTLEYPGSSGNEYVSTAAGVLVSGTVSSGRTTFIGFYEPYFDFAYHDYLRESWQQHEDGITTSFLTARANLQGHPDGMGLEMETDIMAWSYPKYDDFFVLRHTFTNKGAEDITNFWFGYTLPADCGPTDVREWYMDDLCAYDRERGLIYMYDDDGDGGLSPYYIGEALLLAPPVNGSSDDPSITTQKWTTFYYFTISNPLSGREDVYSRLTSGIMSNTSTAGPYDALCGVGPYTLKVGGSLSFTVAILYGEGLPELAECTDRAALLAASDFTVPEIDVPPTIPQITETTTEEDRITISWSNEAASESDFVGYRLYRSDVSQLGPWEVIFDTPSEITYVDKGKIGFPQFYLITSYDTDGNECGIWGERNRTIEPVYAAHGSERTVDKVRVVPNPYLGSAAWEREVYESRLYFTHLPETCKIYIYTLTGELVNTLSHNMDDDPTLDGSGDEAWDLLTLNEQSIVTGLYIYRVVSDNGETHTGTFAVVKGQR